MSTMNLWTRMIALTLCIGLALPAVAAPGMGMGNGAERGGKEGKVPIYALARQADLTTLADLVEIAGLQRTLQVEGPLTVFAPTNEAFENLAAALGQEVLDSIVADPELLTSILLYHVVDPSVGAVFSDVAVTLTEAPMANGEAVSISYDGMDLMINDSTVVAPDVRARNGVVHVVDTVLVPPSVLALLSASSAPVPSMSKFSTVPDQATSFGHLKATF